MHITNKHAFRIIPLGIVVSRKSYLLVRTSISWTSLSYHCLSTAGMMQEWQMHCSMCPGLTSDTAVNPESMNCSITIPHLWFSPQREKLTAVIASLSIAQDACTLSHSMAMNEAVRNEKSLKPASIKPYIGIGANCKRNLIPSVLTWLWGGTSSSVGLVSRVHLHCLLC